MAKDYKKELQTKLGVKNINAVPEIDSGSSLIELMPAPICVIKSLLKAVLAD